MKFNKWTMGLAAVGVVSLASAARADETKMSQVQTALSNTTLSGYVDVAAVFTPGGIGTTESGSSGDPGYYSFAKANGFYLNSIDLALDKPMDESPWASGYHVELMAGPDATPGTQVTWSPNTTRGPNVTGAGVSIRQAYIALRTPIANSGIDWKLGVFDTIIGYESTTDGANPNYTRSYGYTIEPTTHTGVLGTYKVNDMISFSAGIADTTYAYGYLPGVNSGVIGGAMNYPSALGSIALTAPDSWGWAKGATLNAGVVNSPGSGIYGGGATSWYAGATVPTPLTALKVGASWDMLEMHNAGVGTGNPSNDNIWDVALYANFQANDKLSFNLRGEYLNQSGVGDSSTFYVPISTEAEAITATVQYQLWANVLSRAEVRWDHAEHGTPFGSSGAPFYPNDQHSFTSNAFTFAVNLIYQF
jgi:hypothetical protein